MEGTWAMETIMHTFKGAVHHSLGENTHSCPDFSITLYHFGCSIISGIYLLK